MWEVRWDHLLYHKINYRRIGGLRMLLVGELKLWIYVSVRTVNDGYYAEASGSIIYMHTCPQEFT